ncbi:helix-turn-helix domain-containing protein [Paenibacillus sp. GYB004]|uniref:helix-turn-helix transcriptional regulator n=1 Tax=Paenibacillus sp. GYB004 TaxID=2994393 RepID=UPI002F967EDA
MINNVKHLRRSREYDLTQEELAKALGVSRRTIAHMESGGSISGMLMLKVAHFFNKDPREIWTQEKFFLPEMLYKQHKEGTA